MCGEQTMNSATEERSECEMEPFRLTIGIGVVRGGTMELDVEGGGKFRKEASKFTPIVTAHHGRDAKNGNNALQESSCNSLSTEIGKSSQHNKL